jgi:signal transduction histidine kinase
MRERAAAVGGAMHVDSAGRGTRVVVEVAPA